VTKTSGSNKRRKLFAYGMLGNVVEWYEFGVYGYLAGTIGAAFFPQADETVQGIAAFAVFGVGFVMRPVGSIVFGRIGDRAGRGRALSISIGLMALSTLAIGMLPTYAAIGILAPILLCVCRLLQGLSVGGEYAGAITYLFEHAPSRRRGGAASYALLSAIGGLLLGSLTAWLLLLVFEQEGVAAYAWRIPFLLGGCAGLSVFYFRRSIHETPQFLQLRREGGIAESPLRDFCIGWRREAGAIMAILCLQATVFFIIFVLLPTYLSTGDGLLARRLGGNVVAMCLLCLSIPIFGRLSDQMGRVRPHRIGAWIFLALAVPLVLLARDGGFAGLLGAQAVFAILLALIAAPMPAMMAEAFPSQLRYTSVAIAYNVAISFFDGLAPVAVMTLSAVEPNLPWPGLLIAAAAVLTLLGLRAMPETRVMEQA